MNGIFRAIVITGAILSSIIVQEKQVGESKPIELVKMIPVEASAPEMDSNILFTEEEMELIALITMAEAEGECEYGKRLVIDTILNRVESDSFPSTVKEVIYQPYHFESVWNGRVDRCYVDEDILELVREEVTNLSNEDVLYFCAGGYSQYGVPLFQVENHYFSREE